ncbi:hypothetical protein HELRODRAFT_83103, partial [Helobdella robusta]|uniref:C2H2-type domain-containing protein n=1 Tax=Helobdella robusta TaxID=6412 RepID=T1G503_HELRO
PYECNLCGYKARWPSEMTQHMKNHSDEKPYQCPQCSYRLCLCTTTNFFINYKLSNLNVLTFNKTAYINIYLFSLVFEFNYYFLLIVKSHTGIFFQNLN